MDLIEVYTDTIAFAETLPRITETTLHTFEEIQTFKSENKNNISVENIDGISALSKYAGTGKFAILNMASPKTPGGGVKKGSKAQEEGLFRCSDLGLAITTEHYPLQDNQMLYTKNATFFKGFNYEYMQPVVSDVITIAAFKIIDGVFPDNYEEVTKNKIRLMLTLPHLNGVDNLIIGAWGCGVYKNDPYTIASYFKEILNGEGYAGLYNKVLFAVINDHNSVANNYSIFTKVFN